MIPPDPDRVLQAARRWVQALWTNRPEQAAALLSPGFGRHNGWDAAHYLHHELDQYRRHAPFAGWEAGWDVRADWDHPMQCWTITVLDAQDAVTTRFWWWWDEVGVTSNGWPFQMIPKLSWGPWGLRRKIAHDAHGWKVLPFGACTDVQAEHHEQDDGFSAVSWAWPDDDGEATSVQVYAQHPGHRFKTTLSLPGRHDLGFQDHLYPRVKGHTVWVPERATQAFALDVQGLAGHAHVDHPHAGAHVFAGPVMRATLTDRLDHDWTTEARPSN